MINRIELYMADEDSVYLDRLAGYLLSKKNMFHLHTYSDTASLERAVTASDIRIDILAVSEQMNTPLVQKARAQVKVLLTDGKQQNTPTDYEAVLKFQKTDNLVAQLVQMFEMATGQIGAQQQNKGNTCLVGVYSPIGGAGKTVSALLLARAFAQNGASAFYCNMERISSFQIPGPKGVTLSNVLLALQTKGANLELQIRTNCIKDESSGVNLFAAPESTLEWNEIGEGAARRLITTLSQMGAYDVVILDFDSELHTEKLELLACCDHVLVIETTDETAQRKMEAFKWELDLHAADYSALTSRIASLINKDAAGSAQSIPYNPAYLSLENCLHNAPLPPIMQAIARNWIRKE